MTNYSVGFIIERALEMGPKFPSGTCTLFIEFCIYFTQVPPAKILAIPRMSRLIPSAQYVVGVYLYLLSFRIVSDLACRLLAHDLLIGFVGGRLRSLTFLPKSFGWCDNICAFVICAVSAACPDIRRPSHVRCIFVGTNSPRHPFHTPSGFVVTSFKASISGIGPPVLLHFSCCNALLPPTSSGQL